MWPHWEVVKETYEMLSNVRILPIFLRRGRDKVFSYIEGCHRKQGLDAFFFFHWTGIISVGQKLQGNRVYTLANNSIYPNTLKFRFV